MFDPEDSSVQSFGSDLSFPVDIKISSEGSLYYLEVFTGFVYKVTYTNDLSPVVTVQPSDITVTAGQPATFFVIASGDAPFSYQWQRDDISISGATNSSYTLLSSQLSDDGALFRCIVSNSFGADTSGNGTLTVTPNNAPTAAIILPDTGFVYEAGDTIFYSGTGADTEDGALPGSAFTWQVDFHHDAHAHPFIPATAGVENGSFIIPTSGETAANVLYRIILRVVDSGGLADTVFRDVLPKTSTITVTSIPSGLQLLLDGQPQTAPFSDIGVSGIVRTIGAPLQQSLTGLSYHFISWSDAGSADHTISTPPTDSTFTALYVLDTIVVNAKVFLEGPFNGTAMNIQLHTEGLIPLHQPYNAAPWNYAGAESAAVIPATIVDWVLMELRDGNNASTVLARRAAFLKTDGTIVDVNGVSPVVFTGFSAANYYVSIRHRNHLGVMTAIAIALSGISALYDFSTGMNKYFGADAKTLVGGVFGMYAGDFSGDGFIDVLDFLGPDNDTFEDGYRNSDLNLDGFVDASDFLYPDNNLFKGSNIP